ncbi:hypothetical protein [Bulleidia sp. zg-1006]|uniref:hypothetical protein n=1 Tax=Bulleidia sp. zg-1006 TaxID=2806552 RepID=UPI0019399A87|nr:hypothetical protein [Bulleidia sp. zg-1006]QRG86392.1 hypothetical protein JOS54_05930 [Bulleidia sp. zg-1006]
MKHLTTKLEGMSAKQFINQPLEFFEQLYQEALEGIDLTIKESKQKTKGRGRRCKRS